jgi:osmotically-inducible protein OsmY
MRVLLLFTLLAASETALAQNPDFARLDRNGDGYISRVEALGDAEIYKRFAQSDADKDRQLSPAEYLRAREDNERRLREDAELTARVKAALSAEGSIPSNAISIEAYEGGVQLSGFVPAPDIASRAGRLTASISGVRTVHNNLLVRQRQASRMQ